MGVLLAFASIHAALAAEKSAEKRARELGLALPELVPMPPRVRSDCGFGLLFPAAGSVGDEHVAALRSSGIEFDCAYLVIETDAADGKRKERKYERID